MVLSQNFWRTEQELGQSLYSRAGDLDMTCTGSSGCAISGVRSDASVKASPGALKGAEAATEIWEALPWKLFTWDSVCPDSGYPGNPGISSFTTERRLEAPTLFPEEVKPGPTEGFSSQRHAEKAPFRSKNFHVCLEHLRDK